MGTLKIQPVYFKADMRYEIADAEPRHAPHSRQGRIYQPKILTLHYSRRDGEPWKYVNGKIMGWALKKDGTPSQNTVTEQLWLHDSDDWPTWVKDGISNVPERISS